MILLFIIGILLIVAGINVIHWSKDVTDEQADIFYSIMSAVFISMGLLHIIVGVKL